MKKVLTGIAILLCLCILFMSAFSIAHAAEHEGHHHGGEPCQMCLCIARAAQILKGFGLLMRASIPFAPLFFVIALAMASLSMVLLRTPISLHVKLNN